LKTLLVIFQFRELSPFLESVKDLKIDKLWVKFYSQREAYNLARDEFLKRTEYSHFLLLTDDVIVHQSDIDTLVADAQYTDVVSGWFNQNLTTHKNDSNISRTPPPDPPFKAMYSDYQFLPISWIECYLRILPDTVMLPVLHQGTALTMISRVVIERVPFRHSEGCCIDACFSHDLEANGIKQYVDPRVRTLHLKISDSMQARISMVGKNDPTIEYRPN
jgi:hypothetical protein